MIYRKFRNKLIDFKEIQKRIKEKEWIDEFLLYCENNNLKKEILYIVPKSDKDCNCGRFKYLYNNIFDSIKCSRCDTEPEEKKFDTVAISEYMNKDTFMQEFYCEIKSEDKNGL